MFQRHLSLARATLHGINHDEHAEGLRERLAHTQPEPNRYRSQEDDSVLSRSLSVSGTGLMDAISEPRRASSPITTDTMAERHSSKSFRKRSPSDVDAAVRDPFERLSSVIDAWDVRFSSRRLLSQLPGEDEDEDENDGDSGSEDEGEESDSFSSVHTADLLTIHN